MMENPKVFRFRLGRVIEIEHESGRCGYLIAHFRIPKEGCYFSLVTRTFDSPLVESELTKLSDEPRTTVWLNTYRLYGIEGAIKIRYKGDLSDYASPKPTFWFGQVEHFLTIKHPDGTSETQWTTLSELEWEQEMEKKGLIHSVLWLPKAIGAFLFDGIPLRWTAHKKY